MSISHHPTEETLLRYAAGNLPSGPALVVATHLATCPKCCARIGHFEAVGGLLLEEVGQEPLAPQRLAHVLSMIDASEPPPARKPAARRALAQMPPGIELPQPLKDCEIGPWRWLGIGVRASKVTIPGDPTARLHLLRVGAGMKLPDHGHSGIEYTQVIYGSFADQLGRYRPGDLTEMGADVEHQPVVDRDSDCICLAALEGDMVLRGLLGRLIQPFVRL